METIVAKNSGFCGGVLNTVKKTKEYLKENKNVYINGNIVHNEYVINDLKKEGLILIDDYNSIKKSDTVIIRAHGEKKKIYDLLKKKEVNILDLTCPKVKRIHDLIMKHNNDFIVVIGKKAHPEVLGHISYANNYCIIEDINDIDLLLNKVKEFNIHSLYIVAQTTYNDNLFDYIVDNIKKKCLNVKIEVDKTICNATKIRQDEIRDISKKVDKMIIIGSKKSSNTKELVNVAKENNRNVYLIDNSFELKEIAFNSTDKIGIGAGASTPKELIDSVKNYLQNKEK